MNCILKQKGDSNLQKINRQVNIVRSHVTPNLQSNKIL